MGRYKLGPNGGYYDPNDDGPDQFTPTPGQQVPGMPQPQAPPQQAGGVQPPMDFPFPGGGPHQGPWMPPVVDNIPGYDPNNQPLKEVQPWDGGVYKGGYNPNDPMYGKAGSFLQPQLGALGSDQAIDQGGMGQWAKGQSLPYRALSSLGGMFGSSGGNVAPKSSGGIMGRAFPDLFKR